MQSFLPDRAFVEDAFGNAKGGVRTPYTDRSYGALESALRRGLSVACSAATRLKLDEKTLRSLLQGSRRLREEGAR